MDLDQSEARFASYVAGLESVIGHAERTRPLRDYCTGLMLPGERKSVEPMAARTASARTAAQHQSLLHFVANAAWSDEDVLAKVREMVLPAIGKNGPIEVWIIDDTSFPKQGKHSVGVHHQYCGQLGKPANCQVAVSLSIANHAASLPVAYRLYLPQQWTKDRARRKKAGIPKEIKFKTKPEIALEQIRQALEQPVPVGVILADAGYGKGTEFRTELTQLGLQYAVGIESNATVWEPGQGPLRAPARKPGRGAPAKRLQRSANHQPISVKELAFRLPSSTWKEIGWRQGSEGTLRSRFAAVRVRPAHRGYKRMEPYPEEWLLIEWPKKASEPTKYWLSTLPPKTSLKSLVKIAKHRWIVERDYEELKQELGLGHYEGRGWRGFHHHAVLCIAAYGFLVNERTRFSPSARAGHIRLSTPSSPPNFRPRGSPPPPRAA